jgi:IclR helix-turn-helix domain
LLQQGERTTSEVAQRLDLPTGTTERALYELNAHGLLRRGKAGSTDNSANVWWPTADALTHWEVLRPHKGKEITGTTASETTA